MITTGLKNYVYASNYGNIVVSELTDTVNVVLTVEGKTVLEEKYSPDADGKAVIRDIGEILLAYFEQPDSVQLSGSRRKLFLNVRLNIGRTFEHEQIVFYSTISNDIDIDFSFARFLTRYKTKKTSSSRSELISYYDNGQEIYLGVAYLFNGIPKFIKQKISQCSTTHMGISHNLSIHLVPGIVLGASNDVISVSDILYYEAYSVVNDMVVSEVRFVNDTRYFPHESHFLYYNNFGFPETITFTGRDKRSVDPNAVYATLNSEYRKLDTSPIIYDEVNTGYINSVESECIEELLISDLVYLYSASQLGKRIIFTDVKLERSKPDNAPVNYTLTYRPAALKCLEYRSIIYDAGRIFDKTFDDTFE